MFVNLINFSCLNKGKMDHSPNRFGGNGVESILANYKLGKTLGIGSFGKVKIAEHVVTGHKVAIKILNRRKIKNMEMEEKVGREIKILRLFMHHHIIRQYEVIETPSDIYVVMEYVKSGELFDYIVEKGRLQEEEARNFFQQIISGVEYCHRNMVVHRDLKPENLLLDSRCNIKIADFGLSNVMRDGHFLKTSCGSPNYAAPEVISGKLYAGPEVDVWSCGVILYALLCGTLPFDDENIPNLFKKIKGGIYTLPSHLSPDARDLIPRMLVVDPVKRISIPEIRQHRWFQTHLPRYLAVAPPDTLEQAKKINEEIVQEVVNMGFDRNQVMESLRNRVQNDATVTYYLLLDNRFRVPSGYLESEFQETTDSGSNPMRPSPVGQWVPSPMDQYGLGGRSQAPSDRKWALGLQSHAHPREIMNEVLKALQELNVCWKKIGHYNMKCRWVPCFADGLNTRDNNQLHFGDDSSIIEDDCAMTSPTVIKFELQLYKAREEKYLLDIQRVNGPQFLFLDLCSAFLTKLRVI
ncbi:SNF1-related protein kinase catalytic subunit alpha KIN11-like isoform X1 [Brassica napus]|uniref:SNF1-related protein kinase catalytic subunit alpha KIN11-like isoform X1 n=2 Tax=Brassica napus TaxID=3708 RepID=UPI002078A442|nr:SNF1-related protein kinase catalytic subunit alpha KIN11-like isoform X1 [Brassica napus]